MQRVGVDCNHQVFHRGLSGLKGSISRGDQHGLKYGLQTATLCFVNETSRPRYLTYWRDESERGVHGASLWTQWPNRVQSSRIEPDSPRCWEVRPSAIFVTTTNCVVWRIKKLYVTEIGVSLQCLRSESISALLDSGQLVIPHMGSLTAVFHFVDTWKLESWYRKCSDSSRTCKNSIENSLRYLLLQ